MNRDLQMKTTSMNMVKHFIRIIRMIVMLAAIAIYAVDTYMQYSKTVEVEGPNVSNDDRQTFR